MRAGGGTCSRASSLLDLHTLDLQLVQVQVLAGLGVESQGLLSLLLLLPLLLLLLASSLYLLLQLVKLAATGRWRCFKKNRVSDEIYFCCSKFFRSEVLPRLPLLAELHSCSSALLLFDRLLFQDGPEGSFTARSLEEGDS